MPYSKFNFHEALIFQKTKNLIIYTLLLLILEGCYQKPNYKPCQCHSKVYHDTTLIYDSTELIYIGGEIANHDNCDGYDNFFIVSVADSAKWLQGDSSQLIEAYYTKCWDAGED